MSLNLIEKILYIINNRYSEIISAKYDSSIMNDACTVCLADFVGLPAKVIQLTALFSKKKVIFVCKVIFSFCYISCNNCWNLSNDLNKQKVFLLRDKLSQANMAASSGLRENVYPIIFIAKMLVYIILFYYYYIFIILA